MSDPYFNQRTIHRTTVAFPCGSPRVTVSLSIRFDKEITRKFLFFKRRPKYTFPATIHGFIEEIGQKIGINGKITYCGAIIPTLTIEIWLFDKEGRLESDSPAIFERIRAYAEDGIDDDYVYQTVLGVIRNFCRYRLKTKVDKVKILRFLDGLNFKS